MTADLQLPTEPLKVARVRQSLPFDSLPSISLNKSERGLIQRSLLYCFEKGYFSFIRVLLESDSADSRERDTENRTGLMYCCFVSDDSWAENLAMTLLQHGAKIEDQDQRGLNALHYAIITQRVILVRRYLTSLDFNLNYTLDMYGNTCLHYACSTGNADIVRLILNSMKRYSIDLTIKNNFGSTAYDIACQLKHERCQNLLRNETILAKQKNFTPKAINATRMTIKKLPERRLSALVPSPLTISKVPQKTSVVSVPLASPVSQGIAKRWSTLSYYDKEYVAHVPTIFIDPIQSRYISFKHNESLDILLTNQAKTRSDFARSSFIDTTNVLNSFSSTWRDDFSKMLLQLQTYKTPSYRKTIHPPLSKNLSPELYDKLYGTSDGKGSDDSDNPPLSSSVQTNSSQKITHRRRSSTNSNKSNIKTKK